MHKNMTYLLGGIAVGAAGGLFGGGGGMVAVPILRAAGRGVRAAHATAIAVILPVSLAGGLVYLLRGLVPLSVLLPVSLGVASGGVFGAKFLAKLPVRALSLLFALLMFAAGVRMLF